MKLEDANNVYVGSNEVKEICVGENVVYPKMMKFCDTNGYHLSSPSWMNNGDTMQWEQLLPPISNERGWENGYKSYIQYVDGLAVISGNYQVDYIKLLPLDEKLIALSLVKSISTDGALQNATYTNAIARGQVDKITKDGLFHLVTRIGVVASTSNLLQRLYKDNAFIYTMIFHLTNMGMESISSANEFASSFGYQSAEEMPYFDPNNNGTLVAKGGKLYYQ